MSPDAPIAILDSGLGGLTVVRYLRAALPHERAIHRRRHHARLLLRPAPLLVPLVEEGRDEFDAVVKLALQQYLHPLAQRGVDVLVLGCTHYTPLKSLIARIMGKQTLLIDS